MIALSRVLRRRFPNARHFPLGTDYALQDDGGGPYIRAWDEKVMGPKPDAATLAQWLAEHVDPVPEKTTREEVAELKARVAALEAARVR